MRIYAIWLLLAALLLTSGVAFGDLLTVKHAHGSLRIFGKVQVYYATYEDDRVSDTFDLKRARLDVIGQVFDRVYFFVESNLLGKFHLYLASVTLKFPHLDLRFGQQWKPVSWEAKHPTATLPFIFFSLPTLYFLRNNVCFMDIGARATLHFERDGYRFFVLEGGVFNGTGINRGDENDQKDWVVRTAIQPIKGITFVGNYTYGTYGSNRVPDTDPLFGHANYQQYSAGVVVDYQGIDFASEWIAMHRDYLQNKANLDPENKAWDNYGFYTHLGYKIKTGQKYFHQVEPIVRYEYMDRNREVSGDLQRAVTYGVNVDIDKHYARFQVNYVQNLDDSCAYDPVTSPYGKQANNVLAAELLLAF